jgi:hypothetical protein
MDRNEFDDFENALTDLSSGQDIYSVISSYPNLEEEIETVIFAQSLSANMVPSDVLQRSRTKLLMHTMELRREAPPRVGFFQRIPRIVYVILLALFFLLSWNGLITVSAKALPGDHLYPAKITLEKLHLGLALSPQTHQKVEQEYQSRRVIEVKRLLELGRMEFVEFFGILEGQWNDHWIVDGIEVRLLPETIILGDIQNGMMVEVEGSTQPEGWVQASEIHLQNFSFSGTVDLISESIWMISGREVQITSSTLIDSDLQVGDYVMIEVSSDDFGNLTAKSISLAVSGDSDLKISSTPIAPGDIQGETKDINEIEGTNDEDVDGDDADEKAKKSEPEENQESGESEESDDKEESKDDDQPDEADESDESDEANDEDDSDDEDESDDDDERDENDDPEKKDKPSD